MSILPCTPPPPVFWKTPGEFSRIRPNWEVTWARAASFASRLTMRACGDAIPAGRHAFAHAADGLIQRISLVLATVTAWPAALRQPASPASLAQRPHFS